MLIIGAGLSGLLAAQYFRSHNPTISEKQECLPNNHKALLRFRSDAVSTLTGIKFKKVKVSKAIKYKGELLTKSNLMLNNMYSQKVTGSVRGRSISNLEDCERYIAPEDFISKVSNGIKISYATDMTGELDQLRCPIISTMPVHTLAKALEYNALPELKSMPIWTISFELLNDTDVYQTIYYPNGDSLYRVSITGSKVIAEMRKESMESIHAQFNALLHTINVDFGIECLEEDTSGVKLSYQQYGKLIECDTGAVKEFLGWATKNYGIYSLGRWGTHRQLLMDDVVADLKVIDTMIETNGYKR